MIKLRFGFSQTTEKHNTPNPLKTVFTGTGVVFLGMMAGKLLEYLTRVIVGRSLAVAAFGSVLLALSILQVAGDLIVLGLPYGIARFVSFRTQNVSHKQHVSEIMTTALRVIMPLGIVVTAVLWLERYELAYRFNEPELADLLAILIWTFPMMAAFRIFAGLLRGEKAMGPLVISQDLIGRSTRMAIAVIFLALGWGAEGVVAAYAIGFVAMALSAYHYSRRFYQPRITDFWRLSARLDLLTFSLPLAFSAVILQVGGQVNDTLILGLFQDTEAVGLYGAAWSTAQWLATSIMAVNVVFLPVFTELFAANDHKAMEVLYKNVSRWLWYVTLPLFMLMIAFPEVMLILFGEGYKGADNILRVLVIGRLVSVLVGPAGQILLAIGRTRTHMMLDVLYVVVNLTLNIVLVPRWGAIGAAWATAAAMTLRNLTNLFIINRLLHLSPLSWTHLRFDVLTLLVGCAVSGVATAMGWPDILALGVMLSALACSTTIFILRFSPAEDRASISTVRRWLSSR